MKKVELGIPYVNLLWDFLHILKDKDYQILRDYGFKMEVEEGYMEIWINDLINNFCQPLIDYDKDTEIILNDYSVKHISKFDGCEYEISYSVSDEDGVQKEDDITLIWRDPPCGFDLAEAKGIKQRELVGWYWGNYDEETTEQYIKDYYKAKLDKED